MASGEAFAVKDCALIAIATGRKATGLTGLLDNLQRINTDSIYHHFWGGLLSPRFEVREFNNDFAGWVRHSLQEAVLSERLAVIDPGSFANLEELRHELVDIIEERLDESESSRWLRARRQFEFLRSRLVVFDTFLEIDRPEELPEVVGKMSTSSIFYHFIDSRRRLDICCDDFSYWLNGFGDEYQELQRELAAFDPFFSSLSQTRDGLARLFLRYFTGGSR
ncbi:MAG: DUF5752 family protein [Desulfobulbaceae bacterium]|nr:DUF5752 family protein [Desulfobulbaceae bacterium]